MRFGNSLPHSAGVNFVSGGWSLPPEVRDSLNAEVARRGAEIADWMRKHPKELDKLAQPDRERFLRLCGDFGMPLN